MWISRILVGHSQSKHVRPDPDKYQYKPLEHKDDIRLLCLLPGAADDPIHFTLRHVRLPNCHCVSEHLNPRPPDCSVCRKLDDVPAYKALSYTWGDLEKPGTVIYGSDVDKNSARKQKLSVTANCAEALRRLRLRRKRRRLWVDAICIDQHNIPERNRQVGFMHRIFRAATEVIIYLGDTTHDSDRAIALLEREASGSRRLFTDRLELPDINALKSLFQRAWFTRVWVLQEVASAWSASVVCGSQRTSWNNTFNDNFSLWIGMQNDLKPLPLVMGFRAASNKPQFTPKGFLDTLRASRECQSTDPRDKIYALLRLFDDIPSDTRLAVDYGRSIADTFTDVAAYLLESIGPDLLYEADSALVCDLPSWVFDLPSWVPAWGPQFMRKPPLAAGYSAGGPPSDSISILSSNPGTPHLSLKTPALCITTIGIVSIASNLGATYKGWKSLIALWMYDFKHGIYERGRELTASAIADFIAIVFGLPNEHSGESYDAATHLYLQYLRLDHLKPSSKEQLWSNMLSRLRHYVCNLEEGLPEDLAESTEEVPNEAYRAWVETRLEQWIRSKPAQSIHGCAPQSYFLADDGQIQGLVPLYTRSGDQIFIFQGASACYVLRPCEGHYRLIGSCYIQGFPQGKVFTGKSDDGHLRGARPSLWEDIVIR